MISPRSNLASVSAPSEVANSTAHASGGPHSPERAKTLPLALCRVFVGLTQVVSDTEAAKHANVSRQYVASWRDPEKRVTANLLHVASLPDDAFLFVVRGVLNARVTYGKRAYRIVEVDGDDRSVEREARVAQLEATCKQLTAAVAQLTELVQQMQVGK